MRALLIYREQEHLWVPQVYEKLNLEYPRGAEKLQKTFNMVIIDIFLVGFFKDKWRDLAGALVTAIK